MNLVVISLGGCHNLKYRIGLTVRDLHSDHHKAARAHQETKTHF